MNIQQLQYIVAVDEHRHFQRAATACFITPATLSMMIKKLEEELNLIIFDRSKQPVVPTDAGIPVIQKAREILQYIHELESIAKNSGEDISGEIRLAIIPTLAPYLTHLFLPNLFAKYPNLKIRLYEWSTEQIIEALVHNRIDVGVAATPLKNNDIRETNLFYEQLVAFVASKEKALNKRYIVAKDIDLSRLWLLEEEHCLRSQVQNLCSLKRKLHEETQLDFEAGSIDTLLNIVDINQGITVIPELVIHSLSAERKKQIRYFKAPVPVREISLLTYRHFVKEKVLKVLSDEIKIAVSPLLSLRKDENTIIDIVP